MTDAYAATLPEKNAKPDLTAEESRKLADQIWEKIDDHLPNMMETGKLLSKIRDNKLFKGAHTFSEFCRKEGWPIDYAHIAIDFHEAAGAANAANDPDILCRAWNDDIKMRFITICMAMAEKEGTQ